ncbi:hypothetical protein FN846DRAFT_960697, partial [Sphaerosporella brunnea]
MTFSSRLAFRLSFAAAGLPALALPSIGGRGSRATRASWRDFWVANLEVERTFRLGFEGFLREREREPPSLWCTGIDLSTR